MKENKKIMFFISTLGHGQGGHFYSLRDIATTLHKQSEVCIINIGKKKSPVFENLPFDINFIQFNGYNIISAFKKIIEIENIQKSHIYHAFDTEALFFARILSLIKHKPVILTKCGGPNPKKFFPYVRNLIVFSKENYNYFIKNKNINLALIPNRITEPITDIDRIDKLKNKYKTDDKFIILRIGRVTKHYQTTIEQSLNLVNTLIKDGLPVCFIHIGTIQDYDVFNGLIKLCEDYNILDNVFFESDNFFTKNASQLLGFGDLIVGTGRGFMEACAIGKWMLVPNQNLSVPLLVTEENFNMVFNYNFSPRILTNTTYEENINNIKKIISSNSKICPFSKQWFYEYFDINKATDKYLEYYGNVHFDKNIYIVNLILHFFKTIKSFL